MFKSFLWRLLILIGVVLVGTLSSFEFEPIKNTIETDTLDISAAAAQKREDTAHINKLNKIAYTSLTSNIHKSYGLASKAYVISKSINFQKGIAQSYQNFAWYYFYKQDYPKSINYGLKSLKIMEEISDRDGHIDCNNLIGHIFLKQSMYDKAHEFYAKALVESQTIKNRAQIAKSYINMGSIYKGKFDYNNAILYYDKAKILLHSLKDDDGLANCLNEIGMIYISEGNYHNAEVTFKESLRLVDENDPRKSVALIQLGTIYSHKKEYKMALENFYKAVEIEELYNDNLDLAYTYGKIAHVYDKLENSKKALLNANKSLVSAKEVGSRDLMKEAYFILSELHAHTNNYKKAYEFQILHKEMSDSLSSDSKIREVGKIEAKFEFNKKLEEDRIQDEIIIKQNEKVKMKHYLIIAILLPIFFIASFMIAKVRVTSNMITGLVFMCILLIFEFVLVVLDPYIDSISNGAPIAKLVMNTAIALLLMPIHQLLEKNLSRKFDKLKEQREIKRRARDLNLINKNIA